MTQPVKSGKQFVNQLNNALPSSQSIVQPQYKKGIRPTEVDSVYNALAYAETGSGLSSFFNSPWTRTRYNDPDPNVGSSAYGPVQINKSALTGKHFDEIGFSQDEEDWINKTYIPQMDLFLKYGGKDMIPGMERYDYGGKGDFTEADKLEYEKVAKKLIAHQLWVSGGYGDKFIESWRGKPKTTETEKYYDKVDSKMVKKP